MLERGVSVLVNYVLVPVIFIYAVILHAYAVKIALEQSLPEGQIATIVTIFALGGTGAWLIAWPWREEAHVCCAGSSAAGSGSPSCRPSCSPSPSGGASLTMV